MNETALERNDCPLCAGPGQAWARKFDRDLRRCSACGFAWIPQGVMRVATGRSIYEEDIRRFDDSADYYKDASTVDAAREKLAWVRSHARPSGRLLDVGANFGYFAKEASAFYDVIGLEPGAGLVAWGREHLQAPLEVGSVYDDHPEFVGQFDAVTLFDVIEHVPDPRAALERCLSYLAPGGRLFLSTPDAGSAMAGLLGSGWYYIDYVEHIALFNRANLGRLLTDVGMTVTGVRTFGRQYRFSYIERRLRSLAHGNVALRLAHVASLPLLLMPEARIALNLRDVMGLVATRREDS